MKRIPLTVFVDFDQGLTDEVRVTDALNTVLTTALSTPGILDACGDPAVEVSSFYALPDKGDAHDNSS